ncbi:MFS transporter [Candidatus Bathyarchaeota archaeon]|nr:MFS transporter [Candidatus Bathyarchaeota archaeon]
MEGGIYGEWWRLVERSALSDIMSLYVPSFFIFLGMSLVSPILPIYARSYGVSYALASLAISMYAIGRFIADIPTGMAADRFGRKPIMVLGTILLTVTSFLNALASSFWEFLSYRLIQGVGSSMWMTGRTALLADMLKPEERGRVMGYFQAFMLIGSSAGPTIGGIVAAIWDLRTPFYFYALTGLVSLVITIVWIREIESPHDGRGKGQPLSIQVFSRLLSNRSYMMACLATFTVFFMRTGIRGTMIPLYGDGVLGLDTASIGAVISYATFTNLLLTIPFGYSTDYFGRKPTILFSLIVTAASSLMFPMTSDYFQLSLAAVLLGIGTTGAGQAPLALATDASINEPKGLSMGLYRLFGDVGFVIGPIALGLISDYYGLRTPFYFTAVLVFINALLILLLAEETYSRRKLDRSG